MCRKDYCAVTVTLLSLLFFVLVVIRFLHNTETLVNVLQGIEMHMSSGFEKVIVEMKMSLFFFKLGSIK